MLTVFFAIWRGGCSTLKRSFLYRVLSALGICSVLSVTAHCQDMRQAVLMAITQYPTVLAAQASFSAADADIIRAQGAHWPQLSWTGTYNSYDVSNVPNNWIQSPTVNWNIWSGGRISADVDHSRALADGEREQLRLTRDQVAMMAAQGYLNWAQALEMVNVAKTNQEAIKKIYDYIYKIVQNDQGRRVELDQARGRLESAQLTLNQAEANLVTTRERVKRMLQGRIPDKPSGLDYAPGETPQTVEDALDQANDSHPLIANQLAQVQAAKANVRTAQAQAMPQVNLSYGKQTYQGTAQGGYLGQLVVSVPIFQGGTSYGAISTALSQLEAAEHTLRDTRLTLRENVQDTWSNLMLARRNVQTAEDQVKATEKVIDGYWKQFQIGRRSLWELLNAQNDLYSALSAAVNAKFDVRGYRASLLATLGKLSIAYRMTGDYAEDKSLSAPSPSLTTWARANGLSKLEDPVLAPTPPALPEKGGSQELDTQVTPGPQTGPFSTDFTGTPPDLLAPPRQ